MYEEHFGLRQRPFPATPDPAAYYAATSHERALARLLAGLGAGEGLLQVGGAAGTGKTLLCHLLLDRLGPDVTTAFLTNSHLRDRTGLFQAILFDLSLPYQGLGEQEARLALTEHLLKAFAGGRRTVLLVDEAHHLSSDLLEELRLLGNLEGRSGKAIQVVLLGLPALAETLRLPELAAFRQRLAVRVELLPLAVQEAADYLLHHLRVAGGRPERVLADEALELLARATGGVPRLLNQAAHQALALAHEAGAAQVDIEAALEALHLLGLEVEEGGAEEVGVGAGGAQAEGGGPADDPSCRLFVAPPRTG
ncbi:MAG TPA: AAA family ATPase [Gemmataceae bacterium]|nr:AAA family ATPase [Gemmataceae bacterium]